MMRRRRRWLRVVDEHFFLKIGLPCMRNFNEKEFMHVQPRSKTVN